MSTAKSIICFFSSTIYQSLMLLTYSITKAKRALCDVAQFVADSRGAQHFDHCDDAYRCNLRSGVPYIICRGGKVRLIQLLDYLSAAP